MAEGPGSLGLAVCRGAVLAGGRASWRPALDGGAVTASCHAARGGQTPLAENNSAVDEAHIAWRTGLARTPAGARRTSSDNSL